MAIDKDGNITYTPKPHLPGASFDDATPAMPEVPLKPFSNTPVENALPTPKPWTAPPPLSDAAKQLTPQAADVKQEAAPGRGVIDNSFLKDADVPGRDSQLPGTTDPYMRNLYSKNAAVTANLDKTLAGMPSTTGDGGWGALQSMFDVVLQLSKGVGQKKLAQGELARAQQQLQEHERNQAQAEYWRKRGDSEQVSAAAKDKTSEAYSKKVDNQNAHEQRKLKLREQLLNGQLTNQEYANQLKQIEIDMLNPKKTGPANSANPAAAPSTTTTPANPSAATTDNTTVTTDNTTAAPPAQPKIGDGKSWHRGGPDNAMMYLNPDGTFTDDNGRKRDMNGNPI